MSAHGLDIDAIEARANAATPGEWDVWDGPGYVGGGHDLCIGAGETWLQNMDHRNCVVRPCHMEFCSSAATRREQLQSCGKPCELERETDIASGGGCVGGDVGCEHECAITAEQRANAEFIAHAREDVPALIAEVRRLRDDKRRCHSLLEHAWIWLDTSDDEEPKALAVEVYEELHNCERTGCVNLCKEEWARLEQQRDAAIARAEKAEAELAALKNHK